jgi:hypothetical protein
MDAGGPGCCGPMNLEMGGMPTPMRLASDLEFGISLCMICVTP